jgi:hypothetical protein
MAESLFDTLTRGVDLPSESKLYGALSRPQQEAREYHPTWRERLAQTLLGDSAGAAKRDFVKGVMGTTGLGESGVGLIDATPAGVAMSLQEGHRAGSARDMAMAVTPFGVASRAGRAVVRALPSSSSLATPPAPSIEDMVRASRVESVPLAQARGTQPKMGWDKFDAGEHPGPLLKGYEDMPVAVRREDGEYLIFDGHHRSAKAISDGASSMNMYVIDAKKYAPEFAGRRPAPQTVSDDDLLDALKGL